MHLSAKKQLLKLSFIQKYLQYSTKVTSKLKITDNVGIRNKIVYSSYIDEQAPKLNHMQNIMLRKTIQREEKHKRQKNINVRVFPAALKGLEIGIESNTKIDVEPIEEFNDEDLREAPSKTIENWLQDYEYFNESESTQGTADPTVRPSNIPCNGCGAHLHCADAGLIGYVPSEIFRGRSDNELRTIICQRCLFLRDYNVSLDIEIQPEKYVEIVSSIQDKFALVILMVDLLDFPNSIWPDIHTILGEKRPIFLVGNKVDLLPKDSTNFLDHVKKTLIEAVTKMGLNKMNIKNVSLISAQTGFGVEELITQLHKTWKYDGDVYLVGCTNVGKSSLFNALLRSDYCKVEASDLVRRATACPWPGTTLNLLKFPILRPSDIRIYERFRRLMSEQEMKKQEEKLRRDQLKKTGRIQHATLLGHIGRTFAKDKNSSDLFSMPKGSKPILALNENSKDYARSKWCYDTPGVIHPEQIHNLLTIEEILRVTPTEMITPRVYMMKPGLTLFLGGLGRVDFLSGDMEYLRFATYSSHNIPVLITPTNAADEVYNELLGSEYLGIPNGDDDRMSKWPGLKSSDVIEIIGEYDDAATCDILLSSIGWIGLKLPRATLCKLKVWTPNARGIVVRKPALIPYGENLRGKKIRDSLAYRLGKPFIKQKSQN